MSYLRAYPNIREIIITSLGVLLCASFFVGCTSSMTVTVTPTGSPVTTTLTCPADKPSLRYWTRDTFAVALRQPANATFVDDATLSTAAVGQLIGFGIPSQSLTLVPPVIRVGQQIVLFYRIADNNRVEGCDKTLIQTVEAVNTALSPFFKAVTMEASATPVHFTAGGVSFAIVGASPDWTVSSKFDGGDRDWGTPASSPAEAPSDFDPTYELADTALAASTNTGAGKAVVIFDTAPSFGAPEPLINCPELPGSGPNCAPKARPLSQSTALADLVGRFPRLYDRLSSQLWISAMRSVDDTLPSTSDNAPAGARVTNVSEVYPPYEYTDASGTPVSVSDHGLFISGLITAGAPSAQIRLVRVLNDYGVGSLHDILIGIQTAVVSPELLGLDPKVQPIFNFSLNVGPQPMCLARIWSGWNNIQQEESSLLSTQGSDPRTWNPFALDCGSASGSKYKQDFLSALSTNNGRTALLQVPFTGVINEITSLTQTTIIAASGNDSRAGAVLDPGFPAALCNAVSVTGHNANTGNPAPFANRASVQIEGSSLPYCVKVALPDDSATPLTISLAPRKGTTLSGVAVNTCGLFSGTVGGRAAHDNVVLWDGTSFAAGFASAYVAREGVPNAADATQSIPDSQPCNTRVAA